jgi:ATP adenylyltransferase
MDYLWSPWRYRYIAGGESPRCFFCDSAAGSRDSETLIVHRAALSFVILNRYPYTSGHLMVAPYLHVPSLGGLDAPALSEMMLLVQQGEKHLAGIYRPEGFNIGINLGKCAGAGVPGHLHIHVVPRWTGDTNFMTITGETRVLPEDLDVTWQKLSRAFGGQ